MNELFLMIGNWYVHVHVYVYFSSTRRDGQRLISPPASRRRLSIRKRRVTRGGLISAPTAHRRTFHSFGNAALDARARAHAAAASSRPHHVRAMRLAAGAYESYELERWCLRKIKGERGLRVERYESGEVGW